MKATSRIAGIILLLSSLVGGAAMAQHNGGGWRGGPGRGGERGGDRGDRGGDRGRPDHGRPDRDTFQIGVVEVDRQHSYQLINTNAEISQIQVCADRDDLNLQRLDVVFGNGRVMTLAQNTYVRDRDCTHWMDLPGDSRRVNQVVVVGTSDRDRDDGRGGRGGDRGRGGWGDRRSSVSVTVNGRQEQQHWNPGRVWASWGNQTSCGDGAGPFFKDGANNQIPIMACPDQKPNGGPIGMSCGNLPRGTLCYGWRFQAQPGFVCYAPNGKVPPTPAYIYSMYVCP